jgi:hypothetical protein
MGLGVFDVRPLMKRVGDQFGARTFVEGGTFAGATARWASEHFDKVITIEADQSLYSAARKRLADRLNVNCIFGDTLTALPEVLAVLNGPAVFWLDSHWSGPGTYGHGKVCPIREEIRLISAAGGDHFLFVDDARMFLAPPHKPSRIEEWPTIDEVLEVLAAGSPRPYVVVFGDVLVAVPPRARHTVASHCQDAATAYTFRTPWRRVRDTFSQLRADIRHWLTCRQQYDAEGWPL